jgi:hypothetical protein
MFRSALAKRRCLVPADAFYQWKPVQGGKQPYAIARQGGQPMAFAALWEGFTWPDGAVTPHIHHHYHECQLYDGGAIRVIPGLQDWPVWLGEVKGDPASLQDRLAPMC